MSFLSPRFQEGECTSTRLDWYIGCYTERVQTWQLRHKAKVSWYSSDIFIVEFEHN